MSDEARWSASMPEIYDECLGPALFAPYAAHLGQVAASGDARRVLEIAAGTGIATAELVRNLPDARITATDLNPAMVEWASARVPEARWEQADATSLRFSDGSFDLVVCQFGVMFFPDKPAAFAEAARTLGVGGRLLFSTWDVVEASPFPAAMVAALRTVLPEDPPDFISRVPHGYHSADRIERDLRSGGLEVVSLDRVVLRGHAVSAESLTRGFCLGTPLRFALAERGSPAELVPALGSEMVALLGDGPLSADLAAYVVVAAPML